MPIDDAERGRITQSIRKYIARERISRDEFALRAKLGRKCKTPASVCTIDPARPLGSTCSCHHQGKNIKGRVERGGS